jgi:hypothetical protein
VQGTAGEGGNGNGGRGRPAYKASTMYITAIEFENLKGFPSTTLDFTRPDGSYAGWNVFVGGNSSGKSTLLRGMALALLGPENGGLLIGDRQGWILKGESKASAKLSVAGQAPHDQFKRTTGRPPSSLSFDMGVRWFVEKAGDTPQFKAMDIRSKNKGKPKDKNASRLAIAERGPWSTSASGWFSAGYGPMRRLTGSSSESMRYSVARESTNRFVTLFREDAALSESEEWLKRMHARHLESQDPAIDELLKGVRAILDDGLLPQGMHISRITVDQVFIRDERDTELPMRDISDGCRSAYATILDLIHGMFQVYGSEELFQKNENGQTVITRPGVVIIDEIEAHLHPSWQRDIPYWFKTHFPHIQFMVSTHSPLVAQAADPGGLYLLPMQNDVTRIARRASDVEYEKIRWGTAQKTILGTAFGLSTTRTKWAADRIAKWKLLNAKNESGVKLTPSERTDLATLDKQLDLAFEPGEPVPVAGE